MITEDETETWFHNRFIYRIYKSLRHDKCFSQSVANITEYYLWAYS